MSKSDLTPEARALYNRINRRAQGMIRRGEATSALGEFLSLPRLGRGETASKSYLRKLQKLDRSEGLRAAKSRAVSIQEAKILSRALDPNSRSKSSARALRSTVDMAQRTLRAKLEIAKSAGTDAGHLGNIAKTIHNLTVTPRSPMSTLRAAAASASRLMGYKSLTKEGAEKSLQVAIDVFGEGYRDLSSEERSALWREYVRTKQRESLGSFAAVERVGTETRLGNYKFTRDEDGNLTASIGTSSRSAEQEAARREAHQFVLKRTERDASPADDRELVRRKDSEMRARIKENQKMFRF